MGTTAFVGCYDVSAEAPISGTGKTLSMTGFGYLDHLADKIVWSNYHTTFSDEVIGFQAMINKLKGVNSPDTIIGVSEMQNVLNSVGSTQQQVLFIDSFASQMRKIDVDLYYDTQRLMNIHKRLRVHTDIILIPYKTHMDNKPCYFNRCKKPHKIFVYSHKPFIEKPILCFDATEVGKLYDTYEIIYDVLELPKGKKGGEE